MKKLEAKIVQMGIVHMDRCMDENFAGKTMCRQRNVKRKLAHTKYMRQKMHAWTKID